MEMDMNGGSQALIGEVELIVWGREVGGYEEERYEAKDSDGKTVDRVRSLQMVEVCAPHSPRTTARIRVEQDPYDSGVYVLAASALRLNRFGGLELEPFGRLRLVKVGEVPKGHFDQVNTTGAARAALAGS